MTEPLSPEAVNRLITCVSTLQHVLTHTLKRLDALEATYQHNEESWDSMRRASVDYHRRLQNLEAAQQQPAANPPGATKMVPVPEPASPAAPAEGLVEQVAPYCQDDSDDARAAIGEVAAWLDQKGQHYCSLWLREEAH